MIIKVTIGSKKSDNGSISEHVEYIELETFEDFTKEYFIRQLVLTRDVWIEQAKKMLEHILNVLEICSTVFLKKINALSCL